MHYPTVQDVEAIIKKINEHDKMNATIINEGQLEFALARPRIQVYGHEHYPELCHKAAILMEGLTKSHALSDGNKVTVHLILFVKPSTFPLSVGN